jgi:hypothetical protein
MISLITIGPTRGGELAAPMPPRKSATFMGAATPKVGTASGASRDPSLVAIRP